MKNTDQIKLIALDIDGTIMNGRFEISDRVKSTVLKAMNKGIRVILATGRMYSATVPIAADLGIKTPLITYQGSLVREFYNSDRILLHHTIAPEQARKIIQDLRLFDVQINVYLDDEMFIENESHILQEYADKRHIIYHKVNSFDEVVELKPTKILAMNNTPDKVTEVRDYLINKYSTDLFITKSMPIYCEIVNKKASKGNAILFLAKRWNVKPSEIMGIGDQDNDRDMLDIAGLSVAMGNGSDILKKSCDYITDTVDNDGAALAIEKFAL